MKILNSVINSRDSMLLTNKVIDFLKKNPDEKFTARQIAEWIYRTYPEECLQKQARSVATVNPLDSEDALIQQIAAEISSKRTSLQRKVYGIKTTESRPRKYYYTERAYDQEVTEAESSNASKMLHSCTEQDLYPILKTIY